MTDNFEFHALATYNGEVARGLVHTDEWKEHMKREQQRFDDTQREHFNRLNADLAARPLRKKRWWAA